MKISIGPGAFRGEQPRVEPCLLDPSKAQIAQMTKLLTGDLEPWRGPATTDFGDGGGPTFPKERDANEVTLSSSSYQSSGYTATVQVQRTVGTDGPASVRIKTADISGIAGTDYGAIDQLLTWSDGDTNPKYVEIAVDPDAFVPTIYDWDTSLADPRSYLNNAEYRNANVPGTTYSTPAGALQSVLTAAGSSTPVGSLQLVGWGNFNYGGYDDYSYINGFLGAIDLNREWMTLHYCTYENESRYGERATGSPGYSRHNVAELETFYCWNYSAYPIIAIWAYGGPSSPIPPPGTASIASYGLTEKLYRVDRVWTIQVRRAPKNKLFSVSLSEPDARTEITPIQTATVEVVT